MKTTRSAAPAYVAALPALWNRLDSAKQAPRSQRRNALHAVHGEATAAGLPKGHTFWRKLNEAMDDHAVSMFP